MRRTGRCKPLPVAFRHPKLVLRFVSLPVMSEFRELERPQAMRRKDVVLMATVTSFESLPHPSRSELRQFAELFSPLFSASSEAARREAVAALSQSRNVPASVAFFIASQPISVAAPFLVASPCLSNEALIAIARTQGVDHAHAIARRDDLSPTVVDALVGLRFARPVPPPAEAQEEVAAREHVDPMPVAKEASAMPEEAEVSQAAPAEQVLADAQEAERLMRENHLRRRIKLLAGHVERAEGDRLGLRTITPIQTALLVRFARAREAAMFAGVLSDSLSASRWLAERIMLDVSGRQLAMTLKGLSMDEPDALFILERLYSHLAQELDPQKRAALQAETGAEALWNELDATDCGRRIESWRRADVYTYAEPRPHPVQAPDEDASTERAEELQANGGVRTAQEDAPLRTSASLRRSIVGYRRR